jgi:hypothetical protein
MLARRTRPLVLDGPELSRLPRERKGSMLLLLEKSIEAAKGSRVATERMCSRLELFLQQQREFQALLFKELRLDPQIASDKAQMGPDEEEEGDEEMENASGSEEGRSRGDEESMEM